MATAGCVRARPAALTRTLRAFLRHEGGRGREVGDVEGVGGGGVAFGSEGGLRLGEGPFAAGDEGDVCARSGERGGGGEADAGGGAGDYARRPSRLKEGDWGRIMGAFPVSGSKPGAPC